MLFFMRLLLPPLTMDNVVWFSTPDDDDDVDDDDVGNSLSFSSAAALAPAKMDDDVKVKWMIVFLVMLHLISFVIT